MKREDQISQLKELINQLEDGTAVDAGGIIKVPAETYTCEDRFKQEWDVFFKNHAQIIGASADLPEPGSFFTLNDFGIPILATRDEEGNFRAFANICSHRASIVEKERKGSKERFSCPFHGWTYSNKGNLIGYPKSGQFGEIDKSCYGLTPLPSKEKHGLLWVHPDKDGEINVEELLGKELDKLFSTWYFDQLIHVKDDEYFTDMNWKLAIDTFGETYHFSVLHKNSLFESFHGNVGLQNSYDRNGMLTLCKRDIDNMKKEPEENWHIVRGALPVYYLFPNIILLVFDFGMILLREYPVDDSPNKSVSKISFYVWPGVLETVSIEDIRSEIGVGFADVIKEEDYVAAADSHKSLMSGAIDFLTFGRNEPMLHHYHNTYREALGLVPLEKLNSVKS